jgi:hypothetical protein
LLQPGSRSSVGLGGDPFLSALFDETGWWATVDPAESGIMRIEGAIGEPIPSSGTDRQGAYGYESVAAEATWRPSFGARRLTLGVRAQNPDWSSVWVSSSGTVRIEEARPRARVGARLSDHRGRLALQGTARFLDSGESANAFERLGLRVSPTRLLRLQADYGKDASLASIQSSLYDAVWGAAFNCETRTARVAVRLELPRDTAIEWAHLSADYSPDAAISRAHEYQLAPAGEASRDEITVLWRPVPAQTILARWSGLGLDATGEAFWGGERFGLLNYARGYLRAWLLGFEARRERSRFLCDVELASGEMSGRARVETWPFTDVTIDLLGVRRIYEWDCSGEWMRIHGAAERAVAGRHRVRGGLSWYRLWPHAALDDWSPAFLVFGSRDRKHWDLEIKRADLSIVSLGSQIDLRAVRVRFDVQQILYAASSEGSRIGTDDTSDTGDQPAPDGRLEELGTRRWPGGGQIRLALERTF